MSEIKSLFKLMPNRELTNELEDVYNKYIEYSINYNGYSRYSGNNVVIIGDDGVEINPDGEYIGTSYINFPYYCLFSAFKKCFSTMDKFDLMNQIHFLLYISWNQVYSDPRMNKLFFLKMLLKILKKDIYESLIF